MPRSARCRLRRLSDQINRWLDVVLEEHFALSLVIFLTLAYGGLGLMVLIAILGYSP